MIGSTALLDELLDITVRHPSGAVDQQTLTRRAVLAEIMKQSGEVSGGMGVLSDGLELIHCTVSGDDWLAESDKFSHEWIMAHARDLGLVRFREVGGTYAGAMDAMRATVLAARSAALSAGKRWIHNGEATWREMSQLWREREEAIGPVWTEAWTREYLLSDLPRMEARAAILEVGNEKAVEFEAPNAQMIILGSESLKQQFYWSDRVSSGTMKRLLGDGSAVFYGFDCWSRLDAFQVCMTRPIASGIVEFLIADGIDNIVVRNLDLPRNTRGQAEFKRRRLAEVVVERSHVFVLQPRSKYPCISK